MAWDHLSINQPHLVYLILGGFTTLFMLCSSVIKERFYIGEATVATICGIIFGPHAANLINPLDWGNTDNITLEFSRIVLVVQCFAVGVELPKNYMERHWKSVTLLLIPVMTYGWLITSLFIWWMFGSHLNWLDSLCIAACVTATDPVLASSVVGKGKFAKRVPKHLRDLLSAESGCNDGMAFPFIYLAVYLIRYRPDASKVSYHWFCYTILYECIFGAVFGVVVGYAARRAIRLAHERDLIDRESFLVFYFVLALFCAGAGSLLGMDDLLIGFACGVGFSNDGWFQEKTEESHVSNVIDLLINLAFFVYFGTIIPWDQFNTDILGIHPWRLVVVGIFVLFFRRIPIMLALKPIIPDIKTWREAMFAGHFGPIGVGAIFVAILARAELETESTTSLAVLPEPGFEHLNIIEMIWPITCFLVIVSIVVHGSSIAVFTLGRHINTLAISVSFTKANEEGPSWMERLPRIQSRSRTSMSGANDTESAYEEKMEEGMMTPNGLPKNFLGRLKDDDNAGRSSSVKGSRRKKKWDNGIGPGGPVSESAIKPIRRQNTDQSDLPANERSESDTIAMGSDDSPDSGSDKRRKMEEPEEEVYREGNDDIIEDEEGNVLEVRHSKRGESTKDRNRHVKEDERNLMKKKHVEHGVSQDAHENDHDEEMFSAGAGGKTAEEVKEAVAASKWRERTKKYSGARTISTLRMKDDLLKPAKKNGPALAYQFGNTIIVEDEDGEVIKKYDIPAEPKASRPGQDRKASFLDPATRRGLERVGTWVGYQPSRQPETSEAEAGPSAKDESKPTPTEDKDDDKIRFTLGNSGRRLSKADFITTISKTRQKVLENSNAPEAIKREASMAVGDDSSPSRSGPSSQGRKKSRPEVQRVPTSADRPSGPEGLTLVDSNEEDIPFHPVSDTLAKFSMGGSSSGETAAQRRRRQARENIVEEEDDEEEEDEPRSSSPRGRASGRPAPKQEPSSYFSPARPDTANSVSPGRPQERLVPQQSYLGESETAAERKRRLAALGGAGANDDSSSDEEAEGHTGLRDLLHSRGASHTAPKKAEQSSSQRGPKIRFAEPQPKQTASAPSSAATAPEQSGEPSKTSRLRWGANVGKKPGDQK